MINLKNRRLVIAYNPHSSRAAKVKELVFERLEEAGYKYDTIEVKKASLADNVARLKDLIKPGDVIISAAGDGSAHAVAASVIAANQPNVALGFLAFGNFNDLPNVLNSKKSRQDPVELLATSTEAEAFPLEVQTNGRPLRFAMLYATIGWTAEVASYFDDDKNRAGRASLGTLSNYLRVTKYYFKSRRVAAELPLPPVGKGKPSTDLLFVNGPRLAHVFQTGGRFYLRPDFLFVPLNVRTLTHNLPLIVRSVALHKAKGEIASEKQIDFTEPVNITVQCDGEVDVLKSVKTIVVKKLDHPINILTSVHIS